MWHRELTGTTALGAAKALASLDGFAFLDSAMPHDTLGRWSFVTAETFGTFRSRGGTAYWNDTALSDPPLEALRKTQARFAKLSDFGTVPRLAPFQGGAIAAISYDFAHQLEHLAPAAPAPAPIDDLVLNFYDVVLAFDHAADRAWIFSSGLPEEDAEKRHPHARQRGEYFAKLVENAAHLSAPDDAQPANPPIARSAWKSNFDAASFGAAVERTCDYILAGDIYQANIAQCFTAQLPAGFDAWGFYQRLRADNPATFAAYLTLGDTKIASSSPERFVSLTGGRVQARPIKGTAPRLADPSADDASQQALLASEKDRAENLMIVDLLRNDLSRVCAPHSVTEPVLCGLESYASVHHLTSVVTGELENSSDAIDLIAAAFPGGSITGAPKIRAMDIITEIEKQRRGIYCGAIGYLEFNGDMDLNIAIRTVTLTPDSAVFQAGGGITMLSDPQAEYAETLTKASRIFDAFAADPKPLPAAQTS